MFDGRHSTAHEPHRSAEEPILYSRRTAHVEKCEELMALWGLNLFVVTIFFSKFLLNLERLEA